MNNRRRRRLIKPELQTQALFVSLAFAKAAIALTCVTIYLSMRGELAAHPELLEGLPKILAGASFVTMCVLTPILLGYVAYATHRVAGPAYRMEQYLKAYLRGEEQGRLTLREKDELQVLASLLDMALAERNHRESVRTSARAILAESEENATSGPLDTLPSLLPEGEGAAARPDPAA